MHIYPASCQAQIFSSTTFIHYSVVCLTTTPEPPSKRVLHRVRSSASSLSFQYSLVSLKSFSSCFRLLPRLPVTSILPSIFPCNVYQKAVSTPYVASSITIPSIYFMQDIFFLHGCTQYLFVFLAIGSTDILHPSPAPLFKTLPDCRTKITTIFSGIFAIFRRVLKFSCSLSPRFFVERLTMRPVRKVSSHFEYLENRSCGVALM